MTPRSILRLFVMLFDLALAAPARSHAQATPDSSGSFGRTNARLVMRYAVVLNTAIYVPHAHQVPLPMLLTARQ